MIVDLDDVRDIAYEIMDDYGLIDRGWQFSFDQAERRMGSCRHRQKLITMSEPLCEINDEEVIRYTLTHEVAHAIVGPGVGHGFEFVQQCRLMGIDGARCVSDANANEPHWWGRCPSCGLIVRKMWRLTAKAQWIACGACCRDFNGGDYTPRFQLTWEDHR